MIHYGWALITFGVGMTVGVLWVPCWMKVVRWCRHPKLEWEEYPEPLFDPVHAEVSLIVKEWFEQAEHEREEP